MESMLEFYESKLEDDAADDEHRVLKGKRKKKKPKRYFKAVNKRLKKKNKSLEEENKLLKKLLKFYKAHDTEKAAKAAEERKEKDKKSERSFWCKMGDAFVKAVPVILTTLVAAVCSLFCKGKTGNTRASYSWAAGEVVKPILVLHFQDMRTATYCRFLIIKFFCVRFFVHF